VKILKERCNNFAYRGRDDPKWAFSCILRFVQFQKESGKKEITAGTLRNCVKVIKIFCEATDVIIPWKKISKGLPRAKRYADDRAPTLDEIRKITEYPDRRIKSIVYTMASSGIRSALGIISNGVMSFQSKKDGDLVAAKMMVYTGEPDEYFTFISPEAYHALESWVEYRRVSGESVSRESWLMRNLWNSKAHRKFVSKKICRFSRKTQFSWCEKACGACTMVSGSKD
jgi:integrase